MVKNKLANINYWVCKAITVSYLYAHAAYSPAVLIETMLRATSILAMNARGAGQLLKAFFDGVSLYHTLIDVPLLSSKGSFIIPQRENLQIKYTCELAQCSITYSLITKSACLVHHTILTGNPTTICICSAIAGRGGTYRKNHWRVTGT